MRAKTVKRYYCDHCSKGMFKEPSMRDHESTCTRNPNRRCFVCEDEGVRDYPALVAELLKHPGIVAIESPVGDDWHSASSADPIHWLTVKLDCPACVLAVLQQARVLAFEHFDYKQSMTNYMAAKHRELRDTLFNPVP